MRPAASEGRTPPSPGVWKEFLASLEGWVSAAKPELVNSPPHQTPSVHKPPNANSDLLSSLPTQYLFLFSDFHAQEEHVCPLSCPNQKLRAHNPLPTSLQILRAPEFSAQTARACPEDTSL